MMPVSSPTEQRDLSSGAGQYAGRICASDLASTTPAQRARPMSRCFVKAARIPPSRGSWGAAAKMAGAVKVIGGDTSWWDCEKKRERCPLRDVLIAASTTCIGWWTYMFFDISNSEKREILESDMVTRQERELRKRSSILSNLIPQISFLYYCDQRRVIDDAATAVLDFSMDRSKLLSQKVRKKLGHHIPDSIFSSLAASLPERMVVAGGETVIVICRDKGFYIWILWVPLLCSAACERQPKKKNKN